MSFHIKALKKPASAIGGTGFLMSGRRLESFFTEEGTG
jgi:hypothetical protein